MKLIRNLIGLLFSLVILSAVVVIVYIWVNPPVTSVFIQHKFSTSERITTFWVESDLISPYMKDAVLASERINLAQQTGLDAISGILDDLVPVLTERDERPLQKRIAVDLFLWKSESGFVQFLESWFGFLIHLFWSEQRMLEVHLNTAYFGEHQFGVQAAAQHFWRLDSDQVGPAQATLAAAVLPNTDRFSIRNPSPVVRARQALIMAEMAK